MRLLIADDEQIVLDGLTKIINDFDASIDIKTAKSGREAIQAAESFHPDVVFMDIKMPGISGLDALEEIHRQYPQTISIIVSAYEQFEFARSAIRLQVMDYMIKPIYKDRFLDVLKKAERLMKERQAERRNALELREKYQKLIPFFEQDLIFRIVSGMDNPEHLEAFRELFDLPQGLCAFMVLQARLAVDEVQSDYWSSEYLIHQHLLRLAEEIRLKFGCLTGPVSTSPLMILVPLKGTDEYQARLDAVVFAESILRSIPTGLEAAVGIGKAAEFPSGLSHSYQEALMALSQKHLGPIRHYMDLFGAEQEQPDWEIWLSEMESKVLEAVCRGIPDRIPELLNQNLSALAHLSPADFVRLLERGKELEILALREVRKYGFQGTSLSPIPIGTSLESFQHLYLPRLQGWLMTCARFIGENKSERLNAVVSAAKIYIDDHYMEEALSLEEIARQVCVTPYYLSRLFHAEMGMTFTDYLTKTRLDKAVAMLQEGISVKEICFQIGYNDPNYFSRLFRKIYGVPPTEFRKGG